MNEMKTAQQIIDEIGGEIEKQQKEYKELGTYKTISDRILKRWGEMGIELYFDDAQLNKQEGKKNGI